MSGSYYAQFEPAWPGHSVLQTSDRFAAAEIYMQFHVVGLSTPQVMAGLENESVKITDTAIAHAIRESHRN